MPIKGKLRILSLCCSAFALGVTCELRAADGDCGRPQRASGCADASPAGAPAAEPADADDEPEAAMAPVAPTMFAAPTPTGEIHGARSGIGLPSLRFTIPRISIETPELSVLGFSRSRRDAHMQVDGSTAPASAQNPLLFGHIPSGVQSFQPSQGERASAAPADATPADAEGCSSIEARRRQMLAKKNRPSKPAEDGWVASSAVESRQRDEQISQLADQVSELQRAVALLAELKAAEAENNTTRAPSPKRQARAIQPWSQTEVAAQEDELLQKQAERIRELEERLAQMEESQAGQLQTATEPQSTVSGQQSDMSGGKRLFGMMGMSLGRR